MFNQFLQSISFIGFIIILICDSVIHFDLQTGHVSLIVNQTSLQKLSTKVSYLRHKTGFSIFPFNLSLY